MSNRELKNGAYIEEIDRYIRITYYKNGLKHREDGPAIQWSNGKSFWYLNDCPYTEKEFNAWKVEEVIKEIEKNLTEEISSKSSFNRGHRRMKI